MRNVGHPEEKAPEVRKKTSENRSKNSRCHLLLLSLQWPEAIERVSSDKSNDMSLAVGSSAVGEQREGEQRGVTGERRRGRGKEKWEN